MKEIAAELLGPAALRALPRDTFGRPSDQSVWGMGRAEGRRK